MSLRYSADFRRSRLVNAKRREHTERKHQERENLKARRV